MDIPWKGFDMKQGKLEQHNLKNAVFANLTGAGEQEYIGAGIGMDYSKYGDIITADGTGNVPSVAFYKAFNNFYCSLGTPQEIRIEMLLPLKVKESEIKSYMVQFKQLAEAMKVIIVGGHSEVMAIPKPHFMVTVIGKACPGFVPNRKTIKPGYDIILVGPSATLGNNQLLIENEEGLLKRFTKSFLDSAVYQDTCHCAKYMGKLEEWPLFFEDFPICTIHDVSTGGIYQALWQLGEWMHRGFLVENSKLVLNQKTIEICEYLDVNPYFLDGSGSVLVVMEKGKGFVNRLKKEDISANIIGTVTEDKERRVKITDQDIRTLSAITP